MCSNKYSAEVEHEQIKLNKIPNKFIIDKTSLGIHQTALRSEMNTKTINQQFNLRKPKIFATLSDERKSR